MPADVTAVTPMLAFRSRSSVEIGPVSTFARTRTVPETCAPAGLNVRSRSYQFTSYASWFGVALAAMRLARLKPSAFHAARNGATSRSSRHSETPFGFGGKRMGLARDGTAIVTATSASGNAVRLKRLTVAVRTCRGTSAGPVAGRDRP